MSEYTKVNEIKNNEKVYGFYLISSMKKGLTVKKTEYYDVQLQDATGTTLAKVWDANLIYDEQVFMDSMIVYLVGTGNEWQGNMQISVEHIEPVPKGRMEVTEFVKSAPLSIEDMYAKVRIFAEEIQDVHIRTVVEQALAMREEDFKVYPAARGMHHAIYGGLLFHELSMLKIADNLLAMYPFLNKDLVYAGIILHDIEKTSETNAEYGVVKEYTRGGHLLGHIVQGVMLIEQIAIKNDIPQDTKEALQHLVVSHHDKAEWGSPKPPQMPEAVFLHFLDNLDAKMYMVKEAVENANGEWTDKVRGLGNVSLYLYGKNDEE